MAQCSSCEKIGLYKVGNRAFCKEHLDDAKTQLAQSQRKIDMRAGGFERQTRQFEAIMKQADNMRAQHKAAAIRKGR